MVCCLGCTRSKRRLRAGTNNPTAVNLHMQKFNDDLLFGPEDQENARLAFPAIFHVLDDDALRTLFKTFDNPANHAKKRSLRAGILAVALVVIALFGTSAGHNYEELGLSHYAVVFLALVSAS